MADGLIDIARATLRYLSPEEQARVQDLMGRIAALEAEGGVVHEQRKALKAEANAIAHELADKYEELRGLMPANPIPPQRVG